MQRNTSGSHTVEDLIDELQLKVNVFRIIRFKIIQNATILEMLNTSYRVELERNDDECVYENMQPT